MDHQPLVDVAALEARARELLPPPVYDYYAGGANEEITLAEAPASWRRWRLRPHVLRDVATVSTATTLLGTQVSTPVAVAPFALHAMAHPDGEAATAQGAAKAGALMAVSTTATVAIEQVAAAAPAAARWFQLYRVRDQAYTDDLVRRAADAGYRALVVTADLPYLGRRRRDEANAFELPAGLRLANMPESATTDPYHDRPHSFAATLTFADIEHYVALSSLPVVVKGVLRGDDARRCVDSGAVAVWVSTHGGRQLDPVIASADALPEIVDAVGGDVEVYVDGGIRGASDIVVALALGARAVFLARPVIWALATGGAAGVHRMLTGLTAELAHLLGLCGLRRLDEVSPDLVARPRSR